MKDDPDLPLVRRCLSRDPGVHGPAFEQLFRKHRSTVYNIALRITGDAGLASDACQETFLSVHQKLAAFQGQARFSSWLYRIAVNFSIDRKRKASKEPQIIAEDVGLTSDGSEWDFVDVRSVDPESLATSKEFRARILAIVDRLSDPLRVVIVLRYFEAMSYERIGEILGCSIGTVKSRLNRAKAALESKLLPIVQEAPSLEQSRQRRRGET